MTHNAKINIKKVLHKGENEFPKEAFPTISAFANFCGGILVLGHLKKISVYVAL